LKYRELTRRLRRLGCELERQAKGDHEVWINLSTRGRTTIPNWGSKDLKTGTVATILKDLGISREQFDKS